MPDYEPLGYVASALVFATFWMRTMLPLRLVAIASNVAVVGFGRLAGIKPVLMLHLSLLPMNVSRLVQARRARSQRRRIERPSGHSYPEGCWAEPREDHS